MNIKEKIKPVIKFALFFSIGIILFWIAYKDQKIDDIMSSLKHANFYWILLSTLVGILSHISRAIRWKILIEPLGFYPRTMNSFLSVLVMYIANIAFPRMGEITRCGIMNKYEKIPFTKLLGTVFIERLVDVLLLFIFLVIVILTQFDKLIGYLTQNFQSKLISFTTSPSFLLTLVGILIVCLLIFYYFRETIKNTKAYQKVMEFLKNFIEGLKTIVKLEKKGAFIFHSLFIYCIYFLTLYLCFFAFDFTSHLSLGVALACFVMSSLGMVAPSPGGLGTWHIMIIGTLVIYNVDSVQASSFAIAVHGAMTLSLIFYGFLALIYLPIYNRNERLIKADEAEYENVLTNKKK